MKKFVLLSLFLLLLCNISAQQKIRVMSYNIENYPNGKDAHFKKIVTAINPDAIIAIEVIKQAGVNQFLTNVLDTSYSSATVTIRNTNSSGDNGNDCAFYYKKSVLTLKEIKEIPAKTRIISEFKLVHNSTKDTIYVFGVHLKAYPEDTTKRRMAVESFRARTTLLNAIANYLVCGDFNIFSSSEAAFQKLISQSSPGYFIDMMNATGNWNGDPAFSSICTYSAKKLNTRLDMILVSPSLMEKGGVDYINDSFKIFGNDGIHFNDSVNSGTNAWFENDSSLGSSVVSASDHLPIYADFAVGVPTSIELIKELPGDIQLNQNYPNPFNPTTAISWRINVGGNVSLKVFDLLGREVATLVDEFKQPGYYNTGFSTTNSYLTSGVYFYQLKVGNFVQTKKMLLLQ